MSSSTGPTQSSYHGVPTFSRFTPTQEISRPQLFPPSNSASTVLSKSPSRGTRTEGRLKVCFPWPPAPLKAAHHMAGLSGHDPCVRRDDGGRRGETERGDVHTSQCQVTCTNTMGKVQSAGGTADAEILNKTRSAGGTHRVRQHQWS